ncbi:Glycosyl transferase, family 2 [Lachnospiraceae bacterium TWA4]|nr:Glycosyl transferase, family 2 [Lachnospiraceae bacterium TWA4]
MKRAIIVFTRIPKAGQTKTRMMPYLSGKQCKELHQCFLKDILNECRKVKADIFICYTGGTITKPRYFKQVGESLGERMVNAMKKVLDKGYNSCILIGTDIPELRASDLNKAFDKLTYSDLVFGPSVDGGYYLVGMNTLHKEVFNYMNLKEISQPITTIRTLHDMDTKYDLRGYRRRMREHPWMKKTHTGRYLTRNTKISIIVPIYNEEKTIEALQQQLIWLPCEIIFVDGGSTDKTLEKIWPEFHVISGVKGRAAQMNVGAIASSGDVLFFLHCDSELPPHALEQIREVMRDYEAGCFGIAFHSKNFFMWTCRVISNHRAKYRRLPFGDQGIFIDSDLFFMAGMFPEIPIMEDYQFSLKLKEWGVKFGMTRKRIYTSDRRFPKGTIPKLKVMWQMNRLRKDYREGVDIDKISAKYKDIR